MSSVLSDKMYGRENQILCVSIKCMQLRAGTHTRTQAKEGLVPLLGCKPIQAWKIVGFRIYSGKFLLVMYGSKMLWTKKSKLTESFALWIS
jgi:hypothetical protein